MKKLRIAQGVLLAAVAVLLAVFFAFTLRMGDLVNTENDLQQGFAVVFGVLFALIPAFLGVAVAAGLAVIVICLFAVHDKWKTSVAALVILCVFAPFFLFMVVIEALLIAGYSGWIAYLLVAMAAVYPAALALSAVQVHCLRRERAAARAGEASAEETPAEEASTDETSAEEEPTEGGE